MKKINVWSMAVVALTVVLLLPMINVAYEGSAEPAEVENETATVNYSEPQAVDATDEAFEFNDSVTVRNATDDQLEDGTDYEWNDGNGTVSWINTSSTSDGENGSISYRYTVHSETSNNIAAILAPLSAPLGYLILIVGCGSAMYYAFGRGGGF